MAAADLAEAQRAVPEARRRVRRGGQVLWLAASSVVAAGITAAAALWGGAFEWLGAVALWYALWAWAVRRPPSRATIVAIALGLRVVWLPVPLVLSDDAYRYVWDGLVVLGGGSPYVRPPSVDLLLQLKAPWLFERLNSQEYHSVYPTLSQAAFLPAAALYRAAGDGEGGWRWAQAGVKGVFGGAELLVLLLLARRVSRRRLAVYALCPLVVVDGFGQPHTESLAMLLLLAASLAMRPASVWRIAFVGLAGWVKLWPFLLMPHAVAPFVRAGVGCRGRLGAAAALALLALLALPLAVPGALTGLRTSLGLYVGLFEFNAGPYYALKAVGRWATGGDVSKTLGPALGAVFAGGAVGLLALATHRRWRIAETAAAVSGLFLVTATTVHPWYLVPLLGLLAATRSHSSGAGHRGAPPTWFRSPLAWHALGAGSLATYAIYRGGPAAWIVAAGWGAWALLLMRSEPRDSYIRRAVHRVLRFRAGQKLARLSPAFHADLTGLRILDLGCGEGFVGEAMAARGAAVTLADVSREALGSLPFVEVPEEDPLPFDDAAFDLVVLVFVLHHARDPDGLLREACRVGRRVVVLESVFEAPWEERLLRRLDVSANRLRGGWMQPQEAHLAFRTAAAWQTALERASGRRVEVVRLGRVPHRQALLWG